MLPSLAWASCRLIRANRCRALTGPHQASSGRGLPAGITPLPCCIQLPITLPTLRPWDTQPNYLTQKNLQRKGWNYMKLWREQWWRVYLLISVYIFACVLKCDIANCVNGTVGGSTRWHEIWREFSLSHSSWNSFGRWNIRWLGVWMP